MLITQVARADNTVTKDVLMLLVGRHLGGGCSREVFELSTDDTKVIKIEDNAYSFQNITEYDVWERIQWTRYHTWLAPVVAISPCGACLLQERTYPVAPRDLPTFIPEWLTDTKPDNWGWLGDRVVCHDYGFNLTVERGLTKKVVRADWS